MNSKFPVPMDVIESGFIQFKVGKYKYYYVLGSFVRGIDRLRNRLEKSLIEYKKILDLGSYLERGKSFRSCIRDLKTGGIQIMSRIEKYTKEPFYSCNKRPVLDYDKIVESILDNYYCNTDIDEFPSTREYLKKDLENNIFSRKERGILLKEDFVKNSLSVHGDFDYDFSLVPNIIKNKSSKVKIICKSRNPKNPDEVCGEFNTDYASFILKKSNHPILGFFLAHNSIDAYRDIINDWEYRNSGFFPIVTKNHFKPILMDFIARRKVNSTKTDHFWYIPEIGHYVNSKSTLIRRLSNLGINYLVWENRWLLGLDESELFSEKWVEAKIDRFYSDRGVNTKLYIRSCLRKNHNFEFKGYIHRDDFIDEYLKTKSKRKYQFNFDFKSLPEIIPDKRTVVTVICKDTFKDVPIGECKTTYHSFIKKLQDPVEIRSIKLSEVNSMKSEEFFKRVIPKYDNIDFSESVYKGLHTRITVRCKTCGRYYTVLPIVLLNSEYLGCCRRNVISLAEKLVEDWLINRNIKYEFNYPIRDVEGRHSSLIKVDFSIHLNGRKYFIETDGEQHFKYIEHFHRNEEGFYSQLVRDQNEISYCKDNNIILVKIPYTFFSKDNINYILTRILINGCSPDFIIQPKIQKPDNWKNSKYEKFYRSI